MESINSRDQAIVLDREHGGSLRDIARRHGVSHERVRQIVSDATEHVNRVEMHLLVARKEAWAFGLGIPNQDQQYRAIALDYLEWILGRLRARDLDIAVTTKNTSEGLIVFLADTTDYSEEED